MGSDTAGPAPNYVDDGRDTRNGRQWLDSVRGYLLWRAGSDWRRTTSKDHRYNDDRWWYLNGCRLVNDLLSGTYEAEHQAPVMPFPKPAAVDARIKNYCAKSRGWIVAELMRVDPSLTDKKILTHLGREKLARMLVAALNAAQEMEAVIA
jgi:hypothetical protein